MKIWKIAIAGVALLGWLVVSVAHAQVAYPIPTSAPTAYATRENRITPPVSSASSTSIVHLSATRPISCASCATVSSTIVCPPGNSTQVTSAPAARRSLRAAR